MPTANTLFALIAVGSANALRKAIGTKYPGESLEVVPGQWLVARPSTTTTLDISKELGITDGTVSGAIVLSVSSYYGRSSPSTWEWIAAKTGTAPNATQAG